MQFEGCLGYDVGLGGVLLEFIWLFNDLLGA